MLYTLFSFDGIVKSYLFGYMQSMVNDCAGAVAGENDNPFSNRSSASFVLIKSDWRNIRFMKLVLFVSDLLEYNNICLRIKKQSI